MCKSKEEGGHRCFGHASAACGRAQARLHEIEDKIVDALTNGVGQGKVRALEIRRDKARDALAQRGAELASTDKGRAIFQAGADDLWENDRSQAGLMDRARLHGYLQAGQALRQEQDRTKHAYRLKKTLTTALTTAFDAEDALNSPSFGAPDYQERKADYIRASAATERAMWEYGTTRQGQDYLAEAQAEATSRGDRAMAQMASNAAGHGNRLRAAREQAEGKVTSRRDAWRGLYHRAITKASVSLFGDKLRERGMMPPSLAPEKVAPMRRQIVAFGLSVARASN